MTEIPNNTRDILIRLHDGNWGYGYYSMICKNFKMYRGSGGSYIKSDIKDKAYIFHHYDIKNDQIYSWSEITGKDEPDKTTNSLMNLAENREEEALASVKASLAEGVPLLPVACPVAEANDKIADRLDSWLNDKSLWEDD